MKTVREVIRDWIYSPDGPRKIGATSAERADTLISALKEAGYAVVPVEPTERMFWVMKRYLNIIPDAERTDVTAQMFVHTFQAMLAAYADECTASQDQGRG